MSILGGFAMLNEAIRGIRTDNQQHEQRMVALELQREENKAARNDPKLLFERQQYMEKLAPGALAINVGTFNDAKDKEYFSQVDVPAINSVLKSDGMVLNENYDPVMIGTNTIDDTIPKWKRDAIQDKIALAQMGARLENDPMNVEISKLERNISEGRQAIRGSNVDSAKFKSFQLKTDEVRLNELITKRDSPEHEAKRLMDNGLMIEKMYKAAMTNPNIDKEFYGRLDSLQKMNSDRLTNYLKLHPEKKEDLVALNYYRINPTDNSVTNRTVYVNKALAANAATTHSWHDGEYKLGEFKELKDKSGGDGDGKLAGGFTPAFANTISKDYAKAKLVSVLSGLAAEKEANIEAIISSAGLSLSSDELDMIRRQIATGAKQAKEIAQGQATQLERLYGQFDWFPHELLNKALDEATKGGTPDAEKPKPIEDPPKPKVINEPSDRKKIYHKVHKVIDEPSDRKKIYHKVPKLKSPFGIRQDIKIDDPDEEPQKRIGPLWR